MGYRGCTLWNKTRRIVKTINYLYWLQNVNDVTRIWVNNKPSMLDLVFTRSSKEIDYLKFNPCLRKSDHVVLVFSICVEELLRQKKMPLRRDYSRANYDGIRAKLNEVDWAVKFSDKNVNECYKIFLKFHEEIKEECVPKNIDKTEDERKRTKQKQKWLNRKVKSALRKRDDNLLNWKRHKSNENLLIYHKMRNNATNIKREAKMLEECKVIERIKKKKITFTNP